MAAHGEPILRGRLFANPDVRPRHGCRAHTLYGWKGARLNGCTGREIDSRDAYPLNLLVRARFVLVADPFQNHMGADKQRVVKVVYDLFSRHLEFAQDFERLDARFKLSAGTMVTVYTANPADASRTGAADARVHGARRRSAARRTGRLAGSGV